MAQPASSCNSRLIKASPEALYQAFLDPQSREIWLAPDTMTGKIHSFDPHEGGGYQMSLYYTAPEDEGMGKTEDREDRFSARFVELTPPSKIVEAITFDSPDPAFGGEMTMEVTFEPEETGTCVTIIFTNIPTGIKPVDNEAGTEQTLAKLAQYLEGPNPM